MQGIVFYYSPLANPAQAGNALAVHFQSVIFAVFLPWVKTFSFFPLYLAALLQIIVDDPID